VNPLTPLAIRIGGIRWLPRFTTYIVGLDLFLQRASRGRVSLLGIAGLPALTLTVAGRKTGQPRTTPLLCVPHEHAYLVAGSNWGNPQRPAWVLNLLAQPDAMVTVKGRTQQVRARVAADDERAHLWQVMLRTWPNYAKYAERTTREIPVFVLEPHERFAG
jgi:deazaflavin-dependent oxidoreductase (nitroreductase family)